ncbi:MULTISPECIES: TRM11 family SAM-dependent methyltransferase [unclassified Luteococcus]|uniref:TRM11 family SAM-dependent methyltransferase n=1 Tax=unclassified Luteococcus TaxID=2639923 RepID=UPI00313E79C7
MPNHLMLLAPSANRVYAGESAELAAGELAISAPFTTRVAPTTVAGVGYLGFDADQLGPAELTTIARQSATLALFGVEGDLLRPLELPSALSLDDDLVTIPKYPGKTNEQFTRLLVNVTLASIDTALNPKAQQGPLAILDPLCGRGTTLLTAWLLGHHGYGVEGDEKSVEQGAAYLKTWLRRKRIKHTAEITPVRREGKSLGKRFDARLKDEGLDLTIFTGDTRTSQALYGKKKFDAIVTDAPYGVVHGAHHATDVRGHAGKRDRSPAGLIGEALPVWASQLKPGGALGISWNTYGLSREDLADLMRANHLAPQDGEPWRGFAHRVDASINRDLMVAVKQEENS